MDLLTGFSNPSPSRSGSRSNDAVDSLSRRTSLFAWILARLSSRSNGFRHARRVDGRSVASSPRSFSSAGCRLTGPWSRGVRLPRRACHRRPVVAVTAACERELRPNRVTEGQTGHGVSDRHRPVGAASPAMVACYSSREPWCPSPAGGQWVTPAPTASYRTPRRFPGGRSPAHRPIPAHACRAGAGAPAGAVGPSGHPCSSHGRTHDLGPHGVRRLRAASPFITLWGRPAPHPLEVLAADRRSDGAPQRGHLSAPHSSCRRHQAVYTRRFRRGPGPRWSHRSTTSSPSGSGPQPVWSSEPKQGLGWTAYSTSSLRSRT